MNRTSAPNSSSGLYVDDNPATSTQGTLLIATDLNQRQEEIVNTIELSGITPSSGDDTQLGQAVRKLTGNGDYCDETSVDLSSASTSIDLTSFFAQVDGWVESWVWSGGDGTYTLDWDDATYSGKTIGGITANTLTADLKGDGQGRLTLRKQGNDAKVLFFSDHDGGSWTDEKWTKTINGELHQYYESKGGSISGGGTYTWTFPVAFSSIPYGTTANLNRNSADSVENLSGGSGTYSATTTQVTINVPPASNSLLVSAHLWGRWTTTYPVVG